VIIRDAVTVVVPPIAGLLGQRVHVGSSVIAVASGLDIAR
jgi:hypothetical protein